MCAFNQPKNNDDATINKVRGAILHRGLWMGLILKEAKKRGLDWESIGHQALCFLTLYWTIRFDENHVVYAFTSIIFTVVFLWMLNRTTNTLGFTTVPSTTATRAGNSPRWSR